MTSLFTIFITVFLAELGDKTQISAILFSANKNINPFMVFIASCSALFISTAIAVFFGSYMGKYLNAIPLKLIAGIIFILIGILTIFEHFKT